MRASGGSEKDPRDPIDVSHKLFYILVTQMFQLSLY